jgi:type VI secretion system secreted protein VgrG
MSSIEPKQALTGALIVLVIVAMLVAAFAVMVPFTAATSATPGIAFNSGHLRESPSPAATCGQVPVPLASTASYAVLASTTVTSTGATHLTGDLGLSPGTSVTGFPPGTITGTKNVTTPSAAGAEANLTIAYNNASGRSNCAASVAGNIGGQTLTPGLYKSTSSLAISSGDLTLSGGGNPNGIFVFQVASALTTTSGRTVILTNGAQARNVFWQIGSSATLGTTSVMQGTVMAHDSISMLTGSVLNGRAMVETGQVSLADSTITVPTTTSVSTYAVTFTETGLTAGTSWSVTFGGVPASSTTTTIGFNVVSGNYTFTVTVVGYIATPSAGYLVVHGAAAGKTIVCTAAAAGTFGVTFTESGLPSGTSWSVTFNGALNSSTTTTIGFKVAGGTYSYTTGVVSNYTASPPTGSLTVNGAFASQTITFTAGGQKTFGVTFTESGLASGTSWSVIFGGAPNSSTATTIGFNVVNGNYTFTVTVVGYIATPSAGYLLVNGAAASQTITFKAAAPGTFGVTFTESGLPSGTSWSVTYDEKQNTSTTATIGFTVASGNYTYTVGAVANYTASPSTGYLVVNGAAASQTITFTATSSSSSGIPWWEWAVVAVVVVAAAVAIGTAIALRQRGKNKAA